ncbi:Alpha/Beta hydrolase protein [Pseudomassariella vexata]|uniref:Alpha/Beta hydrolase protein n=1 Tax=Pseudomassariella vexata TaxID=1141098 RepID=A0A1Y2DL92_9PEZI|nr:Alpha/Beta hydrolase protein [Pseudomassariella vexata]ORY60023.1 Alpha/Beta hydrolase protein [Pseudomassariella vexata]
MEQLPPLGRGIFEVLEATFAIYKPLILAQESNIRTTRRSTHRYGDHPRQELDVYHPSTPAATPSGARPVLAFFHGGGFVAGAKDGAGYANGLVFANLGHFFASRFGYTVVVANYRLMSHGARYPSGGEDVKLTVEWIAGTLAKEEGYGMIDLFVMGNSAGAVHVATYTLAEEFEESRKAITAHSREKGGKGTLLRGVLLLGAPCHYGNETNGTLRDYFGPDKIFDYAPMGLLQAAKQRGGPELPGVKLALLISEYDPEELVVKTNHEFVKEWPGSNIEVQVLKGQNHISPQLSLATGIEEEEAWGVIVARFCEAAFT